ncbi:hypothetical protein PsYK624_124540 [Phanerochaete sordida]|uniref:Uncharacterized protein n=1 Tax=Phanerochaete sordida TaxID=48140 RepID=A0A9P3GJF3_9APHY|nr:hypothetical protein PsYK624_124540 [Phanerochaete sordida]
MPPVVTPPSYNLDDPPTVVVRDQNATSDARAAGGEPDTVTSTIASRGKIALTQVIVILHDHVLYLKLDSQLPCYTKHLDEFLLAVDCTIAIGGIAVQESTLKREWDTLCDAFKRTRQVSHSHSSTIIMAVTVSLMCSLLTISSSNRYYAWITLPGSLSICCCFVSLLHARVQAGHMGEITEHRATNASRNLYYWLTHDRHFQRSATKKVFTATIAWRLWAYITLAFHVVLLLWATLSSGGSMISIASEIVKQYQSYDALLQGIKAEDRTPRHESHPSIPCNLLVISIAVVGLLHMAYISVRLGDLLFSHAPIEGGHAERASGNHNHSDRLSR